MDHKFDDLLTLDEGRRILESAACKGSIVGIPDLRIEVNADCDFVMETPNGFLPLSGTAAKNLGEIAGLKRTSFKDYLDNPGLIKSMIDHSLQKRRAETRLIFDNEEVLHLNDPKKEWINPLDVYDWTTEIVDKSSRIQALKKNPTRGGGAFEMKFVRDVKKSPPSRVGEYSHSGIWVETNGSVTAAAYVYTLICTNGMIAQHSAPDKKRLKELGTQDGIKMELREKVTAAEGVLDQFLALDAHEIENPEQVLYRLMQDIEAPTKQLVQVMDSIGELPADHPVTEYDLVNLITGMSNDEGDERFQWYGGRAMTRLDTMRGHRCNHCGHSLKN